MAAIQRFGLLLVAPAVAAAPPDFAAPAGGCTVGDCAEGYGRFDMPKGGSYEGDFAAGKSHGFGILEYHTGAIYRGAFVEGRREGYGSYVFEDGATFDGEYVGDRIFGYGAITKKDADGAVELYEGEAAVNAAMGIGRFRFRDGATYEGEVVAGKPHAVWKSTSGMDASSKTSNLSSSVTSKSFRLIFGRIVFSHRVLQA